MPVALTTSGRDKAVPPESLQRLAKVLESMNRKVLLIHREAAGHVTNYEDGVAILEFAIQNAAPRQ
ncbi:MAG: hypothetical protein HY736_15055 [Verrucomicrobia bacterium]|nr:hypothetical protein [Verrucomicrobiota bacterium]